MNKKFSHPLMSWDIISDRRSTDSTEKDYKSLQSLKKRFNWNVSLQSLLKNPFDAIVVTDIDQKIIWTSKGFEFMTGYKTSFAKDKKPSFLQGVNTSAGARQRIREAIQQRQPISETLVNYRKDGSGYNCRVEITPLYNTKNTLTHFIALESEVS